MLLMRANQFRDVLTQLSLVAALGTMVVYLLPFVVLGSDSYITIHDNLDGEFVNKYLLVTTGEALRSGGGAVIDNIMNGLPRTALPSGLNVTVLLFYVFAPATAYIANHVLVHLIAFLGMLLLLRRHFLAEEGDERLALAISLCFFLVPFYTTYGASVAGQPLLLCAFLNIRGRLRGWTDYLIILLFPFWSSMVLVAPFISAALLLVLALDWIRSRALNKRFAISILVFACTYIAVEYQLISSFLFTRTFVSHRTTWDRWTDLDVLSNVKRSFEILLTTQYHTGSFSTILMIVTAVVALVLLVARKRAAGPFSFVAAAIALACLVYGFYDWIVLLFGQRVQALRSFNASRFYFLLPLLWFVLFAMSLKEIKRTKYAGAVVWLLIAVQAYNVLKFNTEYKNNVKLLVGRTIDEPTFRGFFSPTLFAEIDSFIGRPKESYRVVSIGMHPSVALFNGFFTLDSYQGNYPLSYKIQFREIIAKELGKNAKLRAYFDGWGNRCYVFVDELRDGSDGRPLRHLELNTAALARLGGQYIFSTSEIVNFRDNGLIFERQFSGRENSPKIYLYRVAPSL